MARSTTSTRGSSRAGPAATEGEDRAVLHGALQLSVKVLSEYRAVWGFGCM
jgi:hypothetical protein